MRYHLVCVHPFGPYQIGQRIEDQDEIARLMDDRDHHFVKVTAPEPEPSAPAKARPKAAE